MASDPQIVRTVFLVVLAAAGVFSGATMSPDTNPAYSPEITAEDIRAHLGFIASDAMMGRRTGSRGLDVAMVYAAERFREAGLKPVVRVNGAAGFMQPYPVLVTRSGEGSLINLSVEGQTIELRHGDDFVILTPGPPQWDTTTVGVVAAGYGISEPSVGWDDFRGVDGDGRIVLMHLGLPPDEELAGLGADRAKVYRGYRGMENRRLAASMAGARLALFLAGPEEAARWEVWQECGRQLAVRQDTGGEPSYARTGRLAPLAVLHPRAGERLLKWLDLDLAAEGSRERSARGAIHFVSKIERREAANVVAVIEGSDPALRDQFVSLGSHLDHVGVRAGEIYNGADDGGSGPVALLEAAAELAADPPRRSVIFMIYSGEENGLWGSRWFVDHPPVPIDRIIVNINADMVGRDSPEFPQGLFVLGSDRRCAALKELLIAVNTSGPRLPLNFTLDAHDPENLFNRSDHVAFHESGIPTVFFFSGLHEDYHQPGDDIEKINVEKVKSAATLIAALARELANRPGVICRD